MTFIGYWCELYPTQYTALFRQGTYRRLNCSFQSNDMAPHINSNYDFFSCVFADRYNREEVVASLGREINLNPPLTLGQLPDTSEELLKLDQVFTKC